MKKILSLVAFALVIAAAAQTKAPTFAYAMSYDLQVHAAIAEVDYTLLPARQVWLFKSVTWDGRAFTGTTLGAHSAALLGGKLDLDVALPSTYFLEGSLGGASISGAKPGLVIGFTVGRRFPG